MEDNDETALTLKNVDSKKSQDQDGLSAEDLAWVNSCLIEDPEISETSMDSLKEALLNILDNHSEMFSPYANKQDNSNDIIDPEDSPSAVEETIEEEGYSGDEVESSDVLSTLKHPFLPNFNDEMMKIEYSDSDSDDDDDDLGFRLPELGIEPESEGIFKVWELDIPDEEDELVKELDKALSEDGGNRVVPKMKGLEMESVDSLVESIADLSLNGKSVN